MPKFSLQEIEKLSRKNAQAIIEKRDNLKKTSWGKTGWYMWQSMTDEIVWTSFRSGLELRIYKDLDESKLISAVKEEPLIIPYNFKGAKLNYVPDLLIKAKNGNVYLIEIKPDALTEEPKNLAKWEAAKSFCIENGINFSIMTDKNYVDWISTLSEVINETQRTVQQI